MADCFFYTSKYTVWNWCTTLVVLYSFRPAAGCQTSDTEVKLTFEPRHEISNNVVCVTSKASDKLAHTCSLIRAFTSRLSIL